MKQRMKVIGLLVLAAGLAAPRPARPCSSLALLNKGALIFATNYDNAFAPGLLFINRRNVRKSGWAPGTTGAVASWTSRYGSVVISSAGYQLAWGGMNEKGLTFATMLLGGTKPPAPDERPGLAGAMWWQYILDTCATVEDVRAAAEAIRIEDTQDHYLVADRTGACAVVECLQGRLMIRVSLPVAALTNAPYQECLDRLPGGSGTGDLYHSFNRFSRLAAGLAKFREGDSAAAVDAAFGLLADVAAAGPLTRWSFVCDTGRLMFYFRTYGNANIRWIDLNKIDFGCDRPAAMLDAHADLAGDVTPAFREYSHQKVLDHMIKALAYFRPGLSKEFVIRTLALLESFACAPAKS